MTSDSSLRAFSADQNFINSTPDLPTVIHCKKQGATCSKSNCQELNVIVKNAIQYEGSVQTSKAMPLEQTEPEIDIGSKVVQGDCASVEKWLSQKKENLEQYSAKLRILFWTASAWGHTEIVRLLADRCNFNRQPILARALLRACRYKHLDTAKCLADLLASVDPSYLEKSMHHALICSSVNGHVDIVSWLTKTMSLPAMESNSWLMATHCAKGDVEQTKHLAAQIGYNVTPAMSQSLRAAAFRGNQELVTWFLQNTSADVNNRGIIEPAFGDVTALGAACSWGHVEIAHLLLQERECLIDASTSSKGDSPMHLGVWCNNFGWTLLHWAAARGEHEVVAGLVYRGHYINVQDNNGWTPLHLACYYGHLEVLKVLLSLLADYTIANDYGRTPIVIAEANGNINLVEYLNQSVNIAASSLPNVSSPAVSASPPFCIEDLKTAFKLCESVTLSVTPESHMSSSNKYCDGNEPKFFINQLSQFSMTQPPSLVSLCVSQLLTQSFTVFNYTKLNSLCASILHERKLSNVSTISSIVPLSSSFKAVALCHVTKNTMGERFVFTNALKCFEDAQSVSVHKCITSVSESCQLNHLFCNTVSTPALDLKKPAQQNCGTGASDGICSDNEEMQLMIADELMVQQLKDKRVYQVTVDQLLTLQMVEETVEPVKQTASK